MQKTMLTWVMITFISATSVSFNALGAQKNFKTSGTSDSAGESEKKENTFPRFRYELGMSTGTSNGKSFYEANLGLSYYVFEWLSWRNAPFVRFQTDKDTNYGWDTSVRGNYGIRIEDLKIDILGGGGYRIQNLHHDVPFLETGVGVTLGKVRVNGTAKVLLYSWVDTPKKNEMVYTISATGGLSGAF